MFAHLRNRDQTHNAVAGYCQRHRKTMGHAKSAVEPRASGRRSTAATDGRGELIAAIAKLCASAKESDTSFPNRGSTPHPSPIPREQTCRHSSHHRHLAKVERKLPQALMPRALMPRAPQAFCCLVWRH
eukprot:6313421-Amphidinium_carterae.1